MKKILLPALALGAMSSTALAEPMTLTDGEMDRVAAGQFFAFLDKSVFVDEFVTVDVFKTFDTFSFVEGISAHANAIADAFGTDAHAQTLTATFTDDFGQASSLSSSLSQSE